ncbi:hypothetical protein EJB05_01928, partial [Eragrostis curvula]
MSRNRRSSEESVKKKAKINKSSSKAHPQVSSAAVASVPPSKVSAPSLKASAPTSKASVPPSKDSSVRSISAKPAISIKAPVVYNLIDMVTNQRGGGQGSSKTSSAGKGVPPKSSAAPTKGISSSSAEAGKSMIPEKAKFKDKNVAIVVAVPDSSGLKAKIQDKTPDEDRSRVQLPPVPQILVRDVVSPSRGGKLFLHSIFETMQEEFLPFDVAFDSAEVAERSSLTCDEVPANTFVMSAQAVDPFVTAANRIRLPQVEEELMLQGGDTLYKSLLSSQVKEKEEALALSNKRLADLSSEKEVLSQSAKDFELKVTSLDKQVEELDASLAKARNINDDLRGKVDAATLELATFSEAEKLRLSAICEQIRDALVSVGSVPDQLPEDASIEYYQAWLTTNNPYVVQACRAFSNNVVHLAVQDLLRSLEAGGSDALAKAASDSFSFISTDTTPPSLVDALMKFGDHDSSDFSLSEFAIPKPSADASLGKCFTPESSSEISLSKFATPEPSSRDLARRDPPIEIFSSPSEMHLSSDSDPLSPVEGGADSFTFPPGSLVAIGRPYNYCPSASEGRSGRGRRGSRGCRLQGGPSSSRGSVRRKRGGRSRRNSSIDLEDSPPRFDAASQVERMVSSGVVDPVFQRLYSPSSGYNFDEFSIVCQMLIELGLIVKQEPDDDSS